MSVFYSWLARVSVRYRWWFLAVWVVLLIPAGLGASQAERAFQVGGYSLPGTQFYQSSAILDQELNISSDRGATVVFHSDTLLVTDARFNSAVEASLANLRREPEVTKVESFYNTGIPSMVSPDNHTTYALVTLQGTENALEQATPRLRQAVHSNDIQVLFAGTAAGNYDVETASAADLVRVERFTFPIVFILLVIVFGALVAAGVPLVLGAACVLLSLATLYVVSLFTDVSIFALNTASMIGLGLAIDFSLIMVSRFREELRHRPLEEALDHTLNTAGRSITFSGITLTLTMLVLTLFPVMVIRSIALAIVVVALVAVLAGLALLPPLLAVLGTHVNAGSIRRRRAEDRPEATSTWGRWAHGVMRRPWLSIALALVILGAAALPAIRLQRRGVNVDVLPPSAESRQAVDVIRRDFGPGAAAPLFVVVQASQVGGLWRPQIMDGVFALHEHLVNDPRVASVQSLATLIPNASAEWMASLSPATLAANPDRRRLAARLADLDGNNTTTVLIVYPKTTETDPKTVALMLDIRAHAVDWAPGLAITHVLVGGTPAEHYDFDRVVYDQFPLLLGLSLLVTFVILMLFFHSLVLPIKAILLNIISLLASYGILVIVFQFGVGDFLLGFHSLGAILSYTPVLLFSILFGLSTDYEVFLLSRVREYVRLGRTNEDAVALGLEHTAGIITAAGMIMIVVFGSFALTQVVVIKELGFGLAVAVLLDMSLVRMVLVPATMKLMGRWNWWMPRVLDRVVPEIDEGELPAAQPPLELAGAGDPSGS
ncbi:MAG TPA: MMPL family transporter [Thermomicrobiaceae bacterium]|nr:MMPL family transporter [Thermomicrobiaceae bacterium]